MGRDEAKPEPRVSRAITGMVAGGYAVDYDLDAGAVPCTRCGTGLGAGDEVTVALSCYEGYTWEPYAFYCRRHGVSDIDGTTGEGSDEQVVVAATLEATGYHDPRGDHHPDAVSLGGVDVLDYSPITYE